MQLSPFQAQVHPTFLSHHKPHPMDSGQYTCGNLHCKACFTGCPSSIRLTLMDSVHFSGHPGIYQTILLQQDQSCKSHHHLPAWKLIPLSITHYPWLQLGVDFLTDLTISKGFCMCAGGRKSILKSVSFGSIEGPSHCPWGPGTSAKGLPLMGSQHTSPLDTTFRQTVRWKGRSKRFLPWTSAQLEERFLVTSRREGLPQSCHELRTLRAVGRPDFTNLSRVPPSPA